MPTEILGDGQWLPEDFRLPARPPLLGVPGNRTAEALLALVSLFHVDTHERYQPRDVTGDDRDETFCNVFVHDVTYALGCPVPRLLANQQAVWLSRQRDWWALELGDATARAYIGMPTVAVWANPDAKRSGHIALLVPPPEGRSGVWVAQAGAVCSPRMTLAAGFGGRAVSFYTHH